MTTHSYQADRAWSDAYLPVICQILGPLLIRPAPLVLDTREATDLVVLAAPDLRIAARVRRPGYAERYPWDFTLRWRRYDSGVESEIRKVLNKYADWMFYGHAAAGPLPAFDRWMVVDLHSFRHHVEHNVHAIAYDERMNRDQRSSFVSFDVRSFPAEPPILIAGSHDWRAPC